MSSGCSRVDQRVPAVGRIVALLATLMTGAQAEPTLVEVRVLSQGAKFMGDGTGGARVTLIDVASGEELASGVTRGGTGDTGLIMKSCGRDPAISTRDTAAFRTELDIDVPTLVRAEVEGPLARPHVQARATAERWLLPGLGTGSGDGWVLELPGVAVSIRQPIAEASLTTGDDGAAHLPVESEVMMLCGCPLEPGGMWDTAEQRIAVSAAGPGGGVLGPVPLAYAGQPNIFSGSIRLDGPGRWSITVSAYNVRTGATGVARTTVRVLAPGGGR